MPTIHLIRHGQASLGAEDYDRLSALGWQQARRLGEHLAGQGLRPGLLVTGTMRRHQETLHGVLEGMAAPLTPDVMPDVAPDVTLDVASGGADDRAPWRRAALNEYDAPAVIRTVRPDGGPRPDTPEGYRQHFRLIREALLGWVAGRLQPEGLPSHADFRAGVMAALLEAAAAAGSADVLVVSSGGPIATAVAQLLGAPPEAMVELHLRMRNSSVTEIQVSRRGLSLVSFNALPHLGGPEHRAWVTHA